MRIPNLDGYVHDQHINDHLGVIPESVDHDGNGSEILTTDQLWMTTTGRFATRPLSDFKKAVNPLKWDDCTSTKSFFVEMKEVPPETPPNHWPKIIDETVQFIPGRSSSRVTARLEFDFKATVNEVSCTYDLNTPDEITVDKGYLQATPFTHRVPDPDTGAPENVTFFRVKSKKTIAFADGRRAPDPIVLMLWGWGATRVVECAGP